MDEVDEVGMEEGVGTHEMTSCQHVSNMGEGTGWLGIGMFGRKATEAMPAKQDDLVFRRRSGWRKSSPNIERTGGGYSRYLSTDSEMEERVAVVPASQVVSD